MRTLGMLTALLVAYPAAAFSATPGTQQPSAQTKTSASPTKVVCRDIQQTGTRFKRKACGRTTDWDKLEQESTRARQEMGGQGANTSPGE